MRRALLAALCVVAILAGVVAYVASRPGPKPPGAAVGAAIPALAGPGKQPRSLAPYHGLGAWVDGFDFGVAYQKSGAPPVTADVVDDLAAHGVRTLYLQAAREDTRSPGGLVDPGTAGEMLVRAHRLGLTVVAWYLPRFRNPPLDLANLERLADFDVLGHRYDGIAVDIEFTDDVPDTATRNGLLVDLSTKLKAKVGDDPVGAIVLPPVQTEVLNTTLWPDFPWSTLKPLYDVWMPMSYWTFRSEASGYADGYAYNEESTRRLRDDLGDPNVPVHAIGGIGDLVTPETLAAFNRSLQATGAIGGSIYDWGSMTTASRDAMTAIFAPGTTAPLGEKPGG